MAKHVFNNKAMVPVSANVFNFTIWIMIPLTVDGQRSTVNGGDQFKHPLTANGQRSTVNGGRQRCLNWPLITHVHLYFLLLHTCVARTYLGTRIYCYLKAIIIQLFSTLDPNLRSQVTTPAL
jgi:hypothetical protein